MSFASVAAIRQDPWIRDRVMACVAVEGIGEPEAWIAAHAWEIAAQPGWAVAWDSALAGDIDRPGANPAVITDGQILAAVQAIQNAG